jgi:hypothetical protein
LAKEEAWCEVGSFKEAPDPGAPQFRRSSPLQQIRLTPITSGFIDSALCGMRFSIPPRSRNHIETYSRWINAFGLVCVLGAIFWGAILRSHFPSTPLSDPDTWGYLNPALSWLGRQGFPQTAGRGWLISVTYSPFSSLCLP